MAVPLDVAEVSGTLTTRETGTRSDGRVTFSRLRPRFLTGFDGQNLVKSRYKIVSEWPRHTMCKGAKRVRLSNKEDWGYNRFEMPERDKKQISAKKEPGRSVLKCPRPSP